MFFFLFFHFILPLAPRNVFSSNMGIHTTFSFPDDFASTKVIADRQFKKASSLFNSATDKLVGKIDYRHTYVDFSNISVILPSGSYEGTIGNVVKTCPAAVGFSFAAGTTDGPGAFSFKQGDNQVFFFSTYLKWKTELKTFHF